MAYFFQYLVLKIVFAIASLFPLRASIALASGIGKLTFSFYAKRRKTALENLDRAFGDTKTAQEKQRIARASFQSMAMSIADLFLVEKAVQKVDQYFDLQGNEHLEKVFSRGKGAVLVISHLGSWEYLSFLPYITGQKWSVIVKDIKNPYVNQEIDRLRRVMKVVPVPKKNAIKKVVSELKQNHGVAILIDQWDGPNGIWVDFFGEPTSTTSIPARFAEKMGAGLVPAYCIRNDQGMYELQIQHEVSLKPDETNFEENVTRKLNQLLEEKIKQYPTQWSWGHRRWKPKPNYLRKPQIH